MSHIPLVFLFSGQGSQYYQMGQEMYQKHPPFRKRLESAEAVWIEIGGTPILSMLYNKTKKVGDLFDDITLTHPLLFIIQYALAKTMMEAEAIPRPAYLLGASLGEYVSAAVSGAVKLKDAMRLIKFQVEEIPRLCQKGGMTAVLASPVLYENTSFLKERSTIASTNHAEHFVLSGTAEEINQVDGWLMQKGEVFQRLEVAYGFHSPSVDPIKKGFIQAEQIVQRNTPLCSVVSCERVEIINSFSRFSFWEVSRNPINFKKTITLLEENGPFFYLDLGPSGTLATFIKYILNPLSKSVASPLLTPFGTTLSNLDKVRRLLT